MDRRLLLALAATLLIASMVSAAASARLYGAGGVVITIDEYGVAHVSLTVNVSGGLGSVVLPARPVVASLVVSEGGRLLTPIYIPENNTLFFVAPEPGVVNVRYVVNVSAEDGVFRFSVGRVTAKLVLAPNVILLDIPGRVLETGYGEGGRLYVVFQGPATIEYTLKTGATAAKTAAPTAPTATTNTAKPTPTPSPRPTTTPRSSTTGSATLYAAIGVGVVLAAIGVFLALRARRGATRPQSPASAPGGGGAGSQPPPDLNEVDLRILEALEARGGEALQAELQRELGIPKSTLSRRLRRLEEKGYVEIERLGGVNRVRLKKRP